MPKLFNIITVTVALFILLACSPQSNSQPAEAGSEPASTASSDSGGTKRALLIGIDDYLAVSDLAGTGNDVEMMRRVLTSKLEYKAENIVVLRDAEATRDAILTAFRTHLIDRAQPGDHIFIHYSGHGSQMIDADGDEIDQYDETLVPHDSRTAGVYDISDDEINTLLADLAKKTENITVVLDSCHSGSATRNGARARQIPADDRQPPATTWARSATPIGLSDFRQMGSNYVLVTGAAPFELANETMVNGEVFGIMTYNLATTLLNASADTTYKDVMDIVSNKVSAAFPTQHPQLEGTAPDRPVFGGEQVATEAYAIVNPSGANQVVVDHGRLHGLQPGQQLTVFAPQTKDFAAGEGTAEIEIEETDVFAAKGQIVSGTVAEVSRTPVSNFVRGDYVLSIWIGEGADASGALAEAVTDDPGLSAAASMQDAQMLVTHLDGEWQLKMGDLTPLGESVDDLDELKVLLSKWANWYAVLNRSNPKPTGGVSLRIQRDADPVGSPAPAEIEAGDILKFSVRNDSSEPLHVTVIALSTSGNIAPLYYSDAQRLSPGSELPPRRVGTGLPAGMNESIDFFKVYAGKSKIDPTVFTAASVTSRDAFAVDSVDWVTDMVSVRLKRNPTRAEGYVLLLDDATRATRSAGTTERTVCRPGSTTCINGEALSETGDALFIRPTTRSIETGKYSPGEAFQGAYEIGRDYGVKRVEPVFDVWLIDEQHERQTRSGGRDDHDPAAAADHLWSLKYVKNAEARQQLRDLGNTSGAEARGVRIAHLDTGYRRHPEIWTELAGERPVLPDWGLDLVGEDDDPFDDLVTSGTLPNPGHGTASGSVIISPDGCQLSGAEEPCMSGAGPGAQLIPVRVHTSVVVLNQRRLAKAIYAVAEKRIDGDPPLISIAMGGPPSWSLWRATKRAEKAGIAIIAAAGNNVKLVVWPARFDTTIAVGAVNIRCKPWSGSSEGSSVDISAPGESVWRAGVETESQTDFIGMSKGTTYATATTTGVAALWLAKHAGEDLEELRASGQLTRTLRDALQSTAWRPGSDSEPSSALCGDAGWNERRNGAGIVDADALLKQPLPGTSSSRSLRAETFDDLPLYTSMYAEGAPMADSQADYLRLFDSSDLEPVAPFEVEVMFHYTASEEVRAAMDEVAAGADEDEAFDTVRSLLLGQDLSKDLRAALVTAQQ